MYESGTKISVDDYRPPTKLREGSVFRRVCPSFCPQGQGVPCDHYPWCIGIGLPTPPSLLPWTWDFIVQWSSWPQPFLHMGPHCCKGSLLVTSGDQGWRPVQTCLPEDTPQPCWHLVLRMYIRSVQMGGTHPTGMLSWFTYFQWQIQNFLDGRGWSRRRCKHILSQFFHKICNKMKSNLAVFRLLIVSIYHNILFWLFPRNDIPFCNQSLKMVTNVTKGLINICVVFIWISFSLINLIREIAGKQ